jgi:hypothetical protein
MATLASTNVTSSLSPNSEEPFAFGQSGLLIETFRCAGGAAADTVVLTPKYIKKVKTVIAGQAASSNPTTTGPTNVTLTLLASAATSVTFDAWVIGNRE